MTHTSHVEIERKYEAGALAVPSFVGVGPIAFVDEAQFIALVAVYYDTVGFELARNRIALRRREGGGDEGWHLKLPAVEGRTELGWPLSDAEDGVPEPVRDAVREALPDALPDFWESLPLEPIATVTNTRALTVLRNAEGEAIAEFCDDRVRSDALASGQVREWREWEVELLSGAPATSEGRAALLDEIEAAVVAAGATVSASSSKLARALGIEGDA